MSSVATAVSTTTTIYIGNSGAVSAAFETPLQSNNCYPLSVNPATLPYAKEYIILIDTLCGDELDRVPQFAAALRLARPESEVRNSTIANLRAERAVEEWHVKNGDTFTNIQVPLTRQLLPCIKFGSDVKSGDASCEWYHRLLNFALNKTSIEQRCCVVHGPSGVGKTLAIERIDAILTKERSEVAAGIRSDIVTPEMLTISAALIDPENSERILIEMSGHASKSRHNILVIDDFDAGAPKQIIERLEKLQCRRIIICNNFYEHRVLRNQRLYFDIAVNKISFPKLVAYLGECFPRVSPIRRAELAESANGDVRSALIHAKWESMLADQKSSGVPMVRRPEKKLVATAKKGKLKFHWKELNDADNDDDDTARKDSSLVGEMPTYAILRCLRAKRGSVLEKCDSVFGEGDIDTPAQLLFENHCRYNAKEDLDAAALSLELQSCGDVYEQFQWRNQFDGSDASLTDKQISFALQFSGPCLALAKSAAASEGAVYPKMQFPFSAERRRHHESALAIRRMESNRQSVQYLADREAIKAASLSATAITETTLEWSRMLFNRIVGPTLKKAIGIALMPKKDRPANSEIYEALGDVVQQFARLGMDAADFAYACRRHAALYTFPFRYDDDDDEKKKKQPPIVYPPIVLPSNYELQAVFEHYAPIVTASDAELVDDTLDDKPAPKRVAKKKKPESADTDDDGDASTKKRKTNTDAPPVVKKRQTKLLDMLQRQNSAKSVVSANKK